MKRLLIFLAVIGLALAAMRHSVPLWDMGRLLSPMTWGAVVVAPMAAGWIGWSAVKDLPRGQKAIPGIGIFLILTWVSLGWIRSSIFPTDEAAAAWLERHADDLERACWNGGAGGPVEVEWRRDKETGAQVCAANVAFYGIDNGIDAVFAPGHERAEQWMLKFELARELPLPRRLRERGWLLVSFT